MILIATRLFWCAFFLVWLDACPVVSSFSSSAHPSIRTRMTPRSVTDTAAAADWHRRRRRPLVLTSTSTSATEEDGESSSSSSSSSTDAPAAAAARATGEDGASSSSLDMLATAAAAAAATPDTTKLVKSSSRWDSFDYLQHWYPMSWVRDLPVNQPTQLSLFDVNYAVAVIQTTKGNDANLTVTALRDECPHKAAALSEGRITSSGLLQCAYHGWSFDATGTCRQIPQAAASASSSASSSSSAGSAKTSYSTRSCAKAVPAQIHQGLVWLWPGPVPRNTVAVEDLPSPPTLPEMDDPEFVYSPAVRDFPDIDWSLLLSNIMDPDHGLFAHQNQPFDLYSASAELPLRVEETFHDITVGGNSASSQGWTMTSKVQATEKLRAADRRKRGEPPKEFPPNITGTTTFHAPNHVTICRRDDSNDDETKFITAFWVCPTGTGRSRFMSAGLAKGVPFRMPRWITHTFLNGFLDQDTVLVASQQPPVLRAEAAALEEKRRVMRPAGRRAKVGPRGGLFVYQSPTDRSVRLIDQFWDATLDKVPNRAATLLSMKRAGVLDRPIPPRQVVLDRNVQHLQICPDSQDAVRNCQRLRRASLVVTAAWAVAALYWKKMAVRSTCWIPILSSTTGLVTEWIRRRFYYVYTQDRRDRDLAKIPVKIWSDLEN